MSKLSKFAQNRVWVVTGAASGIGLEMVRALLECRAVVWALDLDEAGLKNLVTESLQSGRDVFTQVADVTNPVRMVEVIAEIIKSSKKLTFGLIMLGFKKLVLLQRKIQIFFRKLCE